MKRIIAIMVLILGMAVTAAAQTQNSVDLSGAWKFQVDPTNVGQQKGWQAANFDSSKWRQLTVPGSWESQGIKQIDYQWTQDDLSNPYSGYAWYRRTVTIPAGWTGKRVYLNLGRIDDMDWAYVNGSLVGQTTNQAAPTDTFYRSYEIPASAIRFGQPNVIAIRVLDTRGEGGIVRGPVTLTVEAPEDYSDQQENLGREDKVQFAGGVEVGPDETVGDAVAIGGSVTVRGRVTGDAVAVGGSVRVMPGGHINGDAVSVGGTVIKEKGATIDGETQGIGIGGRYWHGPTNWRDLLMLDMRVRLFKLLASVLFAALAALIVVLFPARIETVADAALSRPGGSALFGLLVALLALPVALLLLATCVGIPLIPVEALVLVAAKVVGHTAIGLAIGRRLGDAVHRPIASGVLAAVIGVLILALVRLVPFAGDLVGWILILIGFGATLATGFGTHAEWFEKRMWRRTPPPPAA